VTHLGRFRDEDMYIIRDCDGKQWVDRLAVYEEMKSKFDGQFETGVINKYTKLLKGKLHGIEKQYEHSVQKLKDRNKARSSETDAEKKQRLDDEEDDDAFFEVAPADESEDAWRERLEKIRDNSNRKARLIEDALLREKTRLGEEARHTTKSGENKGDIEEGGSRDRIYEEQGAAGASGGINDKDETGRGQYNVVEYDETKENADREENAAVIDPVDDREENSTVIDSDDDRQENDYKIKGSDSEEHPRSSHKQSYCDAIRHQRRNIYAV